MENPDYESLIDHRDLDELRGTLEEHLPAIASGGIVVTPPDPADEIWDWIDAVGRDVMAKKLGRKELCITALPSAAANHTMTVVELWPTPMSTK
jgi:hypothetical protein